MYWPKKLFDQAGKEIPCHGSGQDGEYHLGVPWPEFRFDVLAETVLDRLTGLAWSRNASPNTFPVTWYEALKCVEDMNRDRYLGCKTGVFQI